jgi:hypothetical protein
MARLPQVNACLVMANESPPHKTASELRAEADHARKLARELLPNDEVGRRLRRFADELEAQADAVERQASASTPPAGGPRSGPHQPR